MSELAFAPPPPPAVAIEGGGRFPVHRIYCVGRNYADHVREMGSQPTPPFFFM
jgi:fumarylpyruvate hydrolase